MVSEHEQWLHDFDAQVVEYPALINARQMQAVDRRAIDLGVDSFWLMQNAARGVSDRAVAVLAEPGMAISDARIVVLAGPGNNGGDGLVAAAMLRNLGYPVSVFGLNLSAGQAIDSGSERMPGNDSSYKGITYESVDESDALKAVRLWGGQVLSLSSNELPGHIASATLIIDALFGAGLSRAFDKSLADVVRRVNRSSAHVLAVDVPSGLDGNQHAAFNPCIEADSTVTFFRYKPAHVLYPGRALCGHKVLHQIGLDETHVPENSVSCHFNSPQLFRHSLPEPSVTGHKFERGHVLVRGGPIHATGAARLSASTALYAGAGLVTLATSSAALVVNASHLTAVMLSVCDQPEQWQALLHDRRITTLLIGPGNGSDSTTQEAVSLALTSNKPCVLDADALSCWQDQPHTLLSLLSDHSGETVLTPHGGEFARVFGSSNEVMQYTSRLDQAIAAAQVSASVVVFKGADTVIADASGRACINANAPPWLATAGSGDVLAGLIAALMAQGMPAFEAACASVWLHGSAAASLGYPMCAEQLVGAIRLELSTIRASRTTGFHAP